MEGNHHHVTTVREVIGQTQIGHVGHETNSRLIEMTAINVYKCVFFAFIVQLGD